MRRSSFASATVSALLFLSVRAAAAQPSPELLAVLRLEHERAAPTAFASALSAGSPSVRRTAVRAVGRLEQPEAVSLLLPLLRDPDALLRQAVAHALGQSKGAVPWASLLEAERDAGVRSALWENWGRTASASPTAEQGLVGGLTATSATERSGAARGLESYLRRTARSARPSDAALAALRAAVSTNTSAEARQLLLLALTAAGDRDSATVALALRDTSAQVRRVAVAMGRSWVNDEDPMVRWQALRVAGNCSRAESAVTDPDEHVALLAIDLLGSPALCPTPNAALRRIVQTGRTWRMRAHALVSLATVDRAEATRQLRSVATSNVWQARVYAAQAAKTLGDSVTLRQLARDTAPNVAIAAMSTPADARWALASTHAGLLLAAAEQLKGSPALPAAKADLLAAFARLSAMQRVTVRDPRVAIMDRLTEIADISMLPMLRAHLRDIDPEIAARAAKVISRLTDTVAAAQTTRYVPAPFPDASAFIGLDGATAQIRLDDGAVLDVALDFAEAPMAVLTFVQLAEAGRYNGLTFHRIVPNFVIQGGSPGADEYDPVTDTFMRDEVGAARNARGTLGISTRGRDTGDGQIYVNLVDNMRLDHDYTVFGHVTRGMEHVATVSEGDVMRTVTITRARSAGAVRESTVIPAPDTTGLRGARQPALSGTDAMAFALDGQLYLQRRAGEPVVRLTNSSAWHRDPAWTADGRALVYAADSAGNYDLWQITVPISGAELAVPTRLTTHAAHDVSPSVSDSGRLVFARGTGGASRVWLREGDGRERRLTAIEQSERAPRISADGERVAFIVITETGRRVVVRSVARGTETTASTDVSVEAVAWSPDGRLAISSRNGVFAVPADGSYSNLISRVHGDLDWSPDGQRIAIAEFSETAVSYNGDPDRGLDRSAVERALRPAAARGVGGALFIIPAPRAPDAGRIAAEAAVPDDRTLRHGAAFDRFWERSARLYFADNDAATVARRAQWDAVRRALRPRAVAATSDSALQRVIFDALQARPALRTEARGRAAVSSAHPVATEAGLEMMRRGGNVVDAAVAVSFALGVVEPDASGIAGYGEMVIALKDRGAPTLIEFMSRVPEDASLSNTSLLVNGRYPSDGPVLTNVPGTVAGMYTAWDKYGSKRVPWAELLAPAIKAARDGYIVSDGLATTLSTEREHFAKYPGSRALFLRDGKPLQAGDTLRNPDLAWVLERIAIGGADGFYKGDVATKWVTDLRSKGNAMKLSDLARYFAPERAPVRGTYRDYTLYSGAPPVSGGAELVARLHLLEQFPSPSLYTNDAATLHAALTAWFLVPSSRNRIADPALWPVNVAPIINRDTARLRWRCYNPNAALTPASVRGDTLPCLMAATPVITPPTTPPPARSGDENPVDAALSPCGADHAVEMTVCRSSGTTAYTVADNDGNMVAVTQTLGTWGGNFYVTPGLGFLSNDKLTSYGTDPTQYGSRLPYARHGSTIAPTIAFKDNRPVFAVGAAGNAWITSAIYQTLLGALDYNLGPQAALELPRFLPGGGAAAAPRAGVPTPYTLQLEDGFSPAVITRLRALGYDLNFISMRGELREGYGAAVRLDGKTVTAGADPRRSGAAGAIK